jgi:hypothetical protein
MLTTDKQARKERPIARGVLDYFGEAIAEVAHVSFIGNQQHNPGEPLHWAKEKSTDHADCIARHLIDRGKLDDDGMRHSAKAAWRALAMLQIELDQEKGYQATADAHGPEKRGNTGYQDMCADRERATERDMRSTLSFVDAEEHTRNHNREHLKGLGCLPRVAEQIVVGLKYHNHPELLDRYVYVAGPMRGYPEFNFPAFDDARDRLLQNKWTVISPADIDRADGIKEKDHATGDATVFDQRVFVYRDFYALYLIAHTEDGAIAMLPGWEKSTGAVAEFFLARWLGLKILDARTDDVLKMVDVDIQAIARSMRDFLSDQCDREGKDRV